MFLELLLFKWFYHNRGYTLQSKWSSQDARQGPGNNLSYSTVNNLSNFLLLFLLFSIKVRFFKEDEWNKTTFLSSPLLASKNHHHPHQFQPNKYKKSKKAANINNLKYEKLQHQNRSSCTS